MHHPPFCVGISRESQGCLVYSTRKPTTITYCLIVFFLAVVPLARSTPPTHNKAVGVVTAYGCRSS